MKIGGKVGQWPKYESVRHLNCSVSVLEFFQFT